MNVEASDGRQVPMTVFHPTSAGPYDVIAFSHGAFATPERYNAILRPIAAAGYIVIAPMHRDSEEFPSQPKPSQSEVWETRNQDLALAMSIPAGLRIALEQLHIYPRDARPVAMGHSYGALIAQLSGGAKAAQPTGTKPSQEETMASAVIAWSPPGPMPGMMEKSGWASVAVPNLTITGTKDVLPGFIDDWQLHTESFINAPSGNKSLWVGEGIDHYFGGAFGRIKRVSDDHERLFRNALERTVAFLDQSVGVRPACQMPASTSGVRFQSG